MECGSEASAHAEAALQHSRDLHGFRSCRAAGELWSAEAKLPPDAEADASALQIGSRAAPLAHRIGEGLGGKKSVFRWRGWCGVFLGHF